MRLVLMVLMCSAAVVAFAAPSYMTSLELSRDNGVFIHAWCYQYGQDAYAGDQYSAPSGGPWYLHGIKYYVWSQGWPDSIYQGFSVACWKFVDGTPGPVVWPPDGTPIYNPNTGGDWIIQEANPNLNLSVNCPEGFLVGIGFLYSYPACDGFGCDNTGQGPYDWSFYGGTWDNAPYGKGSARALINDIGNPGVETTTIGQIRALYR